MKTQNDIVLNHMRKLGSITAWVAIKRYRITRLARCVGDLEADGHLINHTPICRNGKRYTAYSLVEAMRKAA